MMAVRALALAAALLPGAALAYVPVAGDGDALGAPPLVDMRGGAVDTAHGVTILSFFYTRCPDPRMCPLVTAKFHRMAVAPRRDADPARRGDAGPRRRPRGPSPVRRRDRGRRPALDPRHRRAASRDRVRRTHGARRRPAAPRCHRPQRSGRDRAGRRRRAQRPRQRLDRGANRRRGARGRRAPRRSAGAARAARVRRPGRTLRRRRCARDHPRRHDRDLPRSLGAARAGSRAASFTWWPHPDTGESHENRRPRGTAPGDASLRSHVRRAHGHRLDRDVFILLRGRW